MDEPALALQLGMEEEIVVLKLRGVPFKVNKTKLSNESLYFNRLFAGNYRDSTKKEFDIEYRVNLETFKTFVDWLDDEDLIDDIWGHYYNRVISKYVHRCYRELLELFRFASFYAVDNLLDSLTYIIIHKWLQRDNLIELWLLAEELNQTNLKQVVFATCLDIFEHLPEDAVISLPKENFYLLVNNANLRSSEAHRQAILNEWAKRNERKVEEDSESSEDSSQSDKSCACKARVLSCVTGFRANSNGLEEATVFAWDGHRLEELAKMVDGYKIYTQNGTQIVGRGYSIYIVGGEKFLGHGTFNFYITRFCLITKKWYRVERLLEERRHMVATFVGNKLVLIGGVGKFRIKLTSVHILDIHAGVWTKGKDAPFTFTDIPPFCVVSSRIVIAVNGIHSYDVKKNDWTVIIAANSCQLAIRNILFHEAKLYAFIQTKRDELIKVKICVIERISELSNFTFVTQGEIPVGSSFNILTVDNHFVWFINNNGTIGVRVGNLESGSYKPLLSYVDQRHAKVYFKTNVGCFRILNPDKLFMLRDEESS
ncbi:uncharacterized protein LOC127277943 isoform X1 [Leptopilina boulardi]|uniref:uncharacterized protein LOC127277943 isoform X1 n=1 Tax=Leptopilina boulardi TaxID=63433 RepID=UPI0021F67EBA|nr:uncharacterized protein LOC127277943 isoform X1 [Leptopilina boulardi]